MKQPSERTFRDFLESAPDAMVIVDADGNIAMINAQTHKLFGYGPGELIGKPVDLLVPERLRARHVSHRHGFMADARTRPMGMGLELFGRRKDGTEFPVEISLSPIRTEQGAFVSSAIRDITERKRFERALQEKNLELQAANLAKDTFLAGMSHELRTPLNAIIGFTGTLLMKLPGPLTPDQEQQLRVVQTSARHLLSLINDLLDIAKIESGKVELHFERVAIDDVAGDVVASLRHLADEKALNLEFVRPDSEIVLNTDRRAVHQIVVNLVNNAIKYTSSGYVRVEVERGSPADAVARVIDSGPGIKREDQARIFERFERVENPTAPHVEGAGLGLYLCRRLAELIGGRLTLRSEIGKGSAFTLVVPDHP